MKNYKVTGKFYLICLDNERIIDDAVFLNKIVESKNHKKALDTAIEFMKEKLAKKFHYFGCSKMDLRQKSDVLVRVV